MRHPSIYVKMKVLGAIDVAEGKSRHERIRNVADNTYFDDKKFGFIKSDVGRDVFFHCRSREWSTSRAPRA